MNTDPNAETAPGAAGLSEDLVEQIARHLDEAGEYRITLDPGPPQRVVDLRWAALRAGRRLGRSVKVAVIRGGWDPANASTTVRMTCAPGRGSSIPHQREPRR